MRSYKKKLILFFMTVILILPILSPSIVGAITESTQSTETATTKESTTDQSSSTTSTEQTNSSEDQEIEESIEETIAETNYEERELSDEALEPSPHPVVQLEEENKGSMLVQNENGQEVTRLNKLILQTKQDEGEWQNKQEYDIEDNYNLSEVPYSFEYGADPFQRIIIEYSVEDYQDGRLVKRTKHMAHYMFEATGRKTTDGSFNTENSEIFPVSELQDSTQGITLRPELRGAANDGNTFGMTKHPDLDYGTWKKYSGINGSYTSISPITKNSATIEAMYFTSGNPTNSNKPIVVWSTTDSYGRDRSADFIRSITTKKEVAEYTYGYNSPMKWKVEITGLDPGKTYYIWFYQLKRNSTTEYQTIQAGNVDGAVSDSYLLQESEAMTRRYSFKTQKAKPLTIATPTFTQANATATTIPMVGNRYSGDISEDKGKVQITSNDGNNIREISNLDHTNDTGGTYSDKTLTDLTAGTRYKARVALKDYGGNWKYSNDNWSTCKYFYTPNTANQPAAPTLNTPTTANNATADVSATYVVGDVAAHPLATGGTEVQIKTDNTDWTTINTGSTPATTTPTVDASNKKVTFKLSKLNAKTKYYVRYRVKNASEVWSAYSASREFTAKGRALSKISKPTFSNLTPISARMNEGTYVGDVRSDTTVNGNIYINCNALSNPVVQTPAVSYQNTFSGKYFSRDITNLTPGTRYVTDVRLQNAEGGWVRSVLTNANENDNGWAELITPNRVKKPVVTHGRPPTPTTGEASVKAEYEVGADPRHPSSRGVTDGISGKGVKVEIKEGDGPYISITEDSSSSPSTIRIKPNSLNINSGHTTPNVTFGLIGLKSKTTYTIQVSVKNDSGVWSPVDNNNRQTFTTLGAVLSLSTPTFDLDSGNATSINQNQGSYQGDATAPDTVGKVFLRSNDNANPPSPIISNLQTLSSGNKYAGATLTNLLPGTKYSSRVEIRDYQQAYVTSDWGSFVTPNELVANPNITKTTPTTSTNAGVTIEGIYKAGNANATAAHPNKLNIKISTDGINYEPLPDADSNTTGPKLSSNDVFNPEDRKINIGIDNLLEGTRYYIKYSVENERKKNNGDPFPSNEIQVDFVTLTRPSGLYINEVPEAFNFGTVELSENNMTHPLQNVGGGDNHVSVDFENINVNSQWTLSAKLSKLQVSGGQQTLTGSQIVMDKELKKTSDGGTTWDTPDSAKFDTTLGIQGNSISIPADDSTSVPLFKATDIPYGIGHFENRIPKDSVRLVIPANTGERGKTYSGSITWTLDNVM